MKKILSFICIGCMIGSMAFICPAEEPVTEEQGEAAQEQAGDHQDKTGDDQEKKEAARKLTVEEMATEIVGLLDVYEEILGFIPGLKAEKTPEGEVRYYYVTEDEPPRELKALDENLLASLLIKVQQQATRLHAERIQRQLELIRQIDNLARTARSIPVQVRVPNIPQIPRTPPQPPPQPPRIPAPLPNIPRR